MSSSPSRSTVGNVVGCSATSAAYARGVPSAARRLRHAAFGYLAERYGLTE
ncbi:hypothetical protein [Streptomyces canus]|uniref:hypothetical protein n=1 Tax=Streptomyces canus TaxID=58343 RepID=UPI00278A31E8|nr:hypothetical protein [Streptomyces canus]MDQ1072998.1 hypothetical protein [Streptomyces canus]